MRSFTHGDTVQVRRLDHQGKPFWTPATYEATLSPESALPAGDTPHLVKLGDRILRFGDDDIRGYRPVAAKVVVQNGVQHALQIHDLVIAAMQKLLREEQWVTLVIEKNEGIIYLGPAGSPFSAAISIDPEAVEQHSILGIVEQPGWVINTWHTVSNYPSAPDDEEAKDRGTSTTPHGAAAIAVRVLWELHAEQYWEHIGENGMAAEMTEFSEPIQPEDDNPILTCAFCGITSPEDEARKAAWSPYFFIGDVESTRPACCECAAKHLVDAEGEDVLIEGHETFLQPTPQ